MSAEAIAKSFGSVRKLSSVASVYDGHCTPRSTRFVAPAPPTPPSLTHTRWFPLTKVAWCFSSIEPRQSSKRAFISATSAGEKTLRTTA